MIKIILLTLSIMLFLASCNQKIALNENNFKMDKFEKTSQAAWDSLAQKRIYFGHQSVGFNILEGLNWRLAQNPEIKLRLAKSKELETFKSPVLAHAQNGKNGDPISKIEDFVQTIDQGMGNTVDMAGFKFCYVDFKRDSNIDEIFQVYKARMNYLIKKYPNVQFIHFTSPIKTLQQGPKGFINKLIGREYGLNDNKARQKFNELLNKEYKDQPIFDIALYESIYPDGTRFKTLDENTEIYSMIPELSYDGGHLTEEGKRLLGTHFLTFLANLSHAGNN